MEPVDPNVPPQDKGINPNLSLGEKQTLLEGEQNPVKKSPKEDIPNSGESKDWDQQEELLRLHPEIGPVLQKLKEPDLSIDEFWKTVKDFNDEYCRDDKKTGSHKTFYLYLLSERNIKVNYFDNGNIEIVASVQPVPITETPDLAVQQEPTAISQEGNVSNWKKSEEWKELEKLREELTKAEVHKEIFYAEGLREEYITKKKTIAEMIKNEMWTEVDKTDTVPTSEQEAELNSKINDVLFEELVKKENDAYLDALKTNRGETLGDKVKENLKNVLGSKAVQWYLGQDKWIRLVVTSLLATGVGYAVGAVAATGAVGYAGARVVRGAASFGGATLGATIGEKKEGWSLEDLDKKKEKEIEELKISDKILEEKSKELAGINERYEKEKRNIKLKKAALTIGLGAGTGLLAGLSEQLLSGPKATEMQSTKSKIPEQAPKPASPEPVSVKTEILETETAGPEKLFSDPSVLQHEVIAGDSAWKILKETLNNNDQFKEMTEAQKTYVLSTLINKALENPTEYGLGNDGIIHVGDKINFTKLFEDTEEVKSILDKAKQVIIKGGPQEESILTNNEKIADWVKNNPDVKLTNDKVADILSNKPKIETVPEPTGKIHEPKIITGPIPRFQKFIDQDIPNKTPNEILNDLPSDFSGKTALAAGAAGVAGVAAAGALDKEKIEQTRQEIENAKNRLTELESKTRNPNIERTFASDFNLTRDIETAFRKGVDDIYGKSGFLGMGRIAGVDTKEWGEMARLSASKVVEYYTGDSAKSGLTAEVAEKLSKSSKHNALMKQMVGLMNQSNGAVKPYENENVEQFIKRLSDHIFKTHQESLLKAA